MIQTADHDLAKGKFGSGHRQKKKKKSHAEQELRSDHGRAVNKTKLQKKKNKSFVGLLNINVLFFIIL